MFSPGSGRLGLPAQAKPLYSEVVGQETHGVRAQSPGPIVRPASLIRRSPLAPAPEPSLADAQTMRPHQNLPILGPRLLGSQAMADVGLRAAIAKHALELRRLYTLMCKEITSQVFAEFNEKYCWHLERLHHNFREMLRNTHNFSRNVEHLGDDLKLLIAAHRNHMRAVLRPGALVMANKPTFLFFPKSEADPHRPAQIRLTLQKDYKICLPADYHLLQEVGTECPLQPARGLVAEFYREAAQLAEDQHLDMLVAQDWRSFCAELGARQPLPRP